MLLCPLPLGLHPVQGHREQTKSLVVCAVCALGEGTYSPPTLLELTIHRKHLGVTLGKTQVSASQHVVPRAAARELLGT